MEKNRIDKLEVALGGRSMWIICGILSVIFCAAGWIMVSKKKKNTACAFSACSLAFVSLTLLMEYRIVLDWVNKEEWSSLLDVVPTMFSILTGYVIIMFLANAVLIGMTRKQ